jgi:peptidoglycan/xylan/chitin deacetylase (PgdA/CDA1 family)
MFWLFAAALALKFLSHTAPFPFLLERFAPAQALWKMPESSPPAVYLTFDDGPNPEATPALLDLLRREQVRATFFLIGDHLNDETAPIVRRLLAEGHAAAIHSNTRGLMLKTPAAFQSFLEDTARRIEHLGGAAPCRLFRPHAGWRGGSMHAGAARAGYRIVGWGWGLWDWNWYRRRDGRAIASRIAKRASNGDIIVLHDGHHVNPRADRAYAIEAMAHLIPALRARGFAFLPLCETTTVLTGGSDGRF